MSQKEWLVLFDEDEPEQIIEKLDSPSELKTLLDARLPLLHAYLHEHMEAQQSGVVAEINRKIKEGSPPQAEKLELPCALELNKFLVTLTSLASRGATPENAAHRLRDLHAQFRAEGWQYAKPNQVPANREHSQSQQKKARQPRKPELTEIINELAGRPGGPADLWNAFRESMETAGMKPRESKTDAQTPDLRITYEDQHDRECSITKKRFSDRLKKARQKSQ